MSAPVPVLTPILISKKTRLPQFKLFKSIAEISNEWDQVIGDNNILLSSAFLSALESYPPKGMDFRYLVVYNEYREAIGIMYFQLQYFNAGQSLSNKESATSPCFFSTIHNFLKGILVKQVEFNTFVCGNLLLTGEHGFYFKPGSIVEKDVFHIVSKLMEKAQAELEAQGFSCSVCLLKDYFEVTKSKTQTLIDNQYHEFTIQPNMIMKLNPHWRNLEDYLDSLHSKYRVRAKRAFKKAEHITKRNLSLEEIINLEPEIYHLYTEIAENAGFNVVNLHTSYFSGLKKKLGDVYQMTGYYTGDKLIGFYTTILNGNELEAHFLGYNKKENTSSQLYLNMLFDIIGEGIKFQTSCINFARTALEIKSSVGAEPYEMYCYMKHRNNFSNKFFRPLLDYLNPKFDWEPRHPFK